MHRPFVLSAKATAFKRFAHQLAFFSPSATQRRETFTFFGSAADAARANRGGVGIADKRDPRGAWCYVPAGACVDEEPSAVFPSMLLRLGDSQKTKGNGRPKESVMYSFDQFCIQIP